MSEGDATADLFEVETPESVAFAYELAGLGSRGLALILDTMMLVLITIGEAVLVFLAAVIVAAVAPGSADRVGPWFGGGLLVIMFVTYWGYFIAGEVWGNGRTWGKRRLGIRVVRDDGSRVGAGDSVLRNFLRIIDLLPGSYAVGMFCVLLSKRNKRLGDMAAGTVVVRDTGDDALLFSGGGVPGRVQVAREYLDRRAQLTPAARVQVGVEVLRTFGEVPEPEWDEPTMAGRVADLSGWRELHGLRAAPPAPPAPAEPQPPAQQAPQPSVDTPVDPGDGIG
jgi:uncharacterized RDD family membrane protein YckC